MRNPIRLLNPTTGEVKVLQTPVLARKLRRYGWVDYPADAFINHIALCANFVALKGRP